jgi:hypothetical protein
VRKYKTGEVEWTPARDGLLMKLIAKGLTRTEIARILSTKFKQPVTKNSVIGRSGRISRSKRFYFISTAKPRVVAEPKKDSSGNPGGCQYLKGEPSERDFCGRKTTAAARGGPSSWCEEHYKAVYEKVNSQKAAFVRRNS